MTTLSFKQGKYIDDYIVSFKNWIDKYQFSHEEDGIFQEFIYTIENVNCSNESSCCQYEKYDNVNSYIIYSYIFNDINDLINNYNNTMDDMISKDIIDEDDIDRNIINDKLRSINLNELKTFNTTKKALIIIFESEYGDRICILDDIGMKIKIEIPDYDNTFSTEKYLIETGNLI